MSALRDQIDGREFDWFAVDAEGNLGHFSSAGFGPVPACVLENFHEADALWSMVLRLPAACEAVGVLNGNSEDWLDMARKGLHSFDWSHDGTYRCIATPREPGLILSLCVQIANSIALVKFPGVRFADCQKFSPVSECACE